MIKVSHFWKGKKPLILSLSNGQPTLQEHLLGSSRRQSVLCVSFTLNVEVSNCFPVTQCYEACTTCHQGECIAFIQCLAGSSE